MDWTPTISELSGPRYQRIVEAMEADIAAGRLVRGQQLPTQRALAKALGIDLTTVTRAYTEARRRGIMEARVGQGSFVSETSARLGVRLVGVAMDDGGILPEALAKACRTHRPKAVYLIPTLHNPTTATLLPERRSAIAKIINDADTILIEDDAYGLLDRSAS